jgi:hypothetical protein
VRHRLCKSVVAILLIFSIGGHWAILQSLAWVSMVVQYSQEAPIEVAVSKTFDGKHPCNICKLVKHGRDSEKKRETINQKSKLDFWIPTRALALTLPAVDQNFTSAPELFFHARAEAPPIPPPRWA